MDLHKGAYQSARKGSVDIQSDAILTHLRLSPLPMKLLMTELLVNHIATTLFTKASHPHHLERHLFRGRFQRLIVSLAKLDCCYSEHWIAADKFDHRINTPPLPTRELGLGVRIPAYNAHSAPSPFPETSTRSPKY